jgi:formamidopyrimidine-DNA glycosylase
VWVRSGDPRTGAASITSDLTRTRSASTSRAILRAGPSTRLHGFLRDQHGIAGLGRRLANEICHRAKLSPFAPITKLDDDETARPHAIGSCIDELRSATSAPAMT